MRKCLHHSSFIIQSLALAPRPSPLKKAPRPYYSVVDCISQPDDSVSLFCQCWSWVTMIKVFLVFGAIFRMSIMPWAAVASRFQSVRQPGMMSGSLIRARAMATRCFAAGQFARAVLQAFAQAKASATGGRFDSRVSVASPMQGWGRHFPGPIIPGRGGTTGRQSRCVSVAATLTEPLTFG